MKVLVTGTSSGIGRAIALKYIYEGHEVLGIDWSDSTIESEHYTHIKKDICAKELPDIENVDILVKLQVKVEWLLI